MVYMDLSQIYHGFWIELGFNQEMIFFSVHASVQSPACGPGSFGHSSTVTSAVLYGFVRRKYALYSVPVGSRGTYRAPGLCGTFQLGYSDDVEIADAFAKRHAEYGSVPS